MRKKKGKKNNIQINSDTREDKRDEIIEILRDALLRKNHQQNRYNYNNNDYNNNNNAILKYPTKIPFDPLTGRIIKKISDNNFLYDTLRIL